MHLSREDARAIAARHAEFVAARLTGDAAKAEWRAHLEHGHDALMASPIAALVSEATLDAALEAALASAVLDGAVVPLGRAVEDACVSELRADPTPLGDYVPAGAREKIDQLVTRRGPLPERLVRRVLEHEAMEEVMRDVLADALLQFNTRVNPFFADWGLPGLLKRFMPIGAGAVTKSLEAVRGEFDKRLEPEIRKFLQGFSKQALSKAADFVTAHQGEPKFLGARRAVVTWAYEQSMKDLVSSQDDEARALGRAVAHEVAGHLAAHPRLVQRRRELVRQLLATHGKKTVGQALSEMGITARPDFDAIANLTWPLIQTALAAPATRAWMDEVSREFYDSLVAEGATP